MVPLRFEESKLGDLELVVCKYDLTGDTQSMHGFSRVYLHNTYKFTDLDTLLTFHKSCGYAGIGYHFAIAEDGTVFSTRPLDLQGAQVLGRNTNSVGVVFLNVERCAQSKRARNSFKRLYQELKRISDGDLVVSSHTYGQFEYLRELVILYNQGLNGKAFLDIDFDESVCRSEILFSKKAMVVDDIIKLRGNGIPEERKKEFERIVWFTDKLKVCPGENYFVFSSLMGKRKDDT